MSIFGHFHEAPRPVTKEEATPILNEVSSIMNRIGQRFPVLMTYWISSVSKVIITRATQTADVNLSGTVRINPEFWTKELTSQGRRAYLLCHEVMHPFCAHLDRRGNRDPRVWNVAGDAIINTILDTTSDSSGQPLFMDDDKIPGRITLPEGYSTDPAHLVTEMVYDYLCRNAPPPPPPPPEGDDGDDSEPEDQESDEGEDGAGGEGEGEGDEDGEPGDGEGEGSGEGEGDDGEGDGEGDDGQGSGTPKPGSKPGSGKPGSNGTPRDEQITKGPQPQPGTGCGMRETKDAEDKANGDLPDMMGKKVNPNPVDLSNSANVDQIQAKADSIEGILSQGGIGSGHGGFAGMIGRRDGRADWRAILRRVISAEVSSGSNKDTYSRMSRRGSQSPQILRSGHYDDKITIGVLFDVSGSVPRDWVERSVGESVRVAKHYPTATLWAAAHTTEVIGPVILDASNVRQAQKAFAALTDYSGGTDCHAAYRLASTAKPKIDVLIHFTDGEITPWPYPTGIKKVVVIVVGRTDASQAKAWAPPQIRREDIHVATDTGLRPSY